MAKAILIIEDETVLAKNIRLYLERAGYEASTAESAEDGLRQISDFRPDIVLLDYQLPGRTGLELLADLKKRDPDIVVIMMTGQGSVGLAVEAMKLGAVDFLTKPVVLEKLKLLIEKILGTEKLEKTLAYYQSRERQTSGLDRMLGESPPIRQLKSMVLRLLDAEAALGDDEPPAILITGETGTGKEVLARAIHFDGPRHKGPFIELNCGLIPQQLLEAELFGYERGAFTDAKERKIGLVEAADGGTLFLDEIGDMDFALQVKLLKLLEEKKVRRLGSVREQKVNVRIIAATNQPLEQLVSDGRFRSDLFFRLRIVEIVLPPLRDRGHDILLLARHFLSIQGSRYNKGQLQLSDEAETALMSYDWPGNIRELRNIVEQTVLLTETPHIQAAQLPFCALLGKRLTTQTTAVSNDSDQMERLSLDKAEKDLLLRALEKTGWNVTQAARLLGVSRDTLRYRIEKHALVR